MSHEWPARPVSTGYCGLDGMLPVTYCPVFADLDPEAICDVPTWR